MARDYAKHPSPVSPINNSVLVTVAILLIIQGAWSQRVKVVPEVEAYPAGEVELRCQFADGGTATKLTQVSWIWEQEEGQRDNIAVFHPTYGESFPDSPFSGRVVFMAGGSLTSPSIRISKLTMQDAGRYTCEYATYPSGNEQGTTTLIMLAKPKNSASPVTVPAGSKAVVVARCEAADGKPAAEIKWLSTLDGSHNTTSAAGADGTVTVRSAYSAVPSAALNGREVTCIVSQRTQDKPQTFSMKLNVEYPPTVTIEGYDENWYVGRTDVTLTCAANANPVPTTVLWTSMSGPMPDTVEVSGNQLTVRRVDDSVNTTFVCEVRNRLGVSKQQVTTMVIEPIVDPSNAGVVAGAIIGSLLALLLVGSLVAVLVTRSRRQQQRRAGAGYPGNGDMAGGGAYSNNKARLFGASDNGGGNNNGPIYTYRESQPGTDKPGNEYRSAGTGTGPAAHDILLQGEMDQAERRKFDGCLDDSLEDEEERYDGFGGVGMATAYHIGRGGGGGEAGSYLEDDMESQRDGSVISRTAIYV